MTAARRHGRAMRALIVAVMIVGAILAAPILIARIFATSQADR